MYVKKLRTAYVLFLALMSTVTFQVNAQVGIGTTTPDASAVLDITSSTQGLLAPRMTTTQRGAIVSPAKGLIVFDTDLDAFFYFDGASWEEIIDGTVSRDNYKLIKSGDVLATVLADELAAGSGTTYVLDANTLYEFNGTILFDFPIELNNAYLTGNDVSNDVLVNTTGGALFTGNTGGSIRSLTAAAGGNSMFNLTMNATATERLVMQSCVFAGPGTVGTISDATLVFMSIIQFAGFTNGVTFTDIDSLLLDNLGWLATNSGTMQTFTGTFDLITQSSGFVVVDAGETGFDLSSNPTINESASLETVTFSGAGTPVNGYTTGTYPGFSFTTDWTVNCSGIPVERDASASANIYYNGNIVTGFNQTVLNSNTTPFNLTGIGGSNTTTAVNMFRTSSATSNRITYEGSKRRIFQVNASLSVLGNANSVGKYFAFLIVKNGTTSLVETNTLMRVNNSSDVNSLAIVGTVEMDPGDFIEIWGQRLTGSGNADQLSIFSLNLSIQ
ncbi:cell wall anchor protein [Ascidiimonas sp. W6]|uniref:cell wall anchor protein n=1 Tax=Ascidiimonas meishanensis TaxID=3128903 RepID=UPI0030EE202D